MGATEEALLAIAFYVALGLMSFWYVRKNAHPDRKPWVAWLQFVGIISGIVVGTLVVLVAVAMSTDIGGSALGRAAASVIVIGVLIPTWRYAKASIRKPPMTPARDPGAK